MKEYCTYFDKNYIDRGLALHESMEAHCQPYRLWILALCEKARETLARLQLPNVEIVSMGEFLTSELRKAESNRSRHEWIWTLTPWWMLWLFEKQGVPHLNYIDADCYWFNKPAELFGELFNTDIAITPHRFSASRKWMEETNGKYNVGLVFIKRNWAGLTCLQEWAKLCLNRCVQDEGADQKYWDDLLPQYKGHEIEHKGVDLAPWNQRQYSYSLRGNEIYVDEDPLVFYHFHKRLEPGFELDPFVEQYIYGTYREALDRVKL